MKNKSMKLLAAGVVALIISMSGIIGLASTTTEKGSEKTSVAARHPKTVRITVNKDGFSPSQVRAEKGYELTLIFTRTDNKGCSKDVVISSLNIRRKLLLNKEVTIAITPQEAGEIVFACSSGKAKGTITIH